MMRSTLFTLLILSALAGCSVVHPPEDEAAGEAFLANVCSSGETNLASANSSRTNGHTSVCVNDLNGIKLLPYPLRLHAVTKNEFYVSARCEHGYKTALDSMEDSGEMALVVDDEVQATFHYLRRTDISHACGVFPMSSYEDAIELCESLAGSQRDACFSVCNGVTDSAPVCAIAGVRPERIEY